MIEFYKNDTLSLGLQQQPPQKRQKILTYEKNERMGGTVPKWSQPKTQTEKIEQNLTLAMQQADPATSARLAYAASPRGNLSAHQQEFGFADLVDMVNPLQHIPLVNTLYREVTGDQIRPAGQIVGGAIFGGPGGAASGVINAIVKEETGRDIGQNAYAMLTRGETPAFKHIRENAGTARTAIQDVPRAPSPTKTAPAAAPQDLPGSLLSFADLKAAPAKGFKTERLMDEKTAATPAGNSAYANGAYKVKNYEQIANERLSPREPITQVKLGGLYALAQR